MDNEILLFSTDDLGVDEAALCDNNKYSVYIYPDRNRAEGFYKDPYIKVYNSHNKNSATECIRVFMKDAGCIYHRDDKRNLPIKREWTMFLDSAMPSPCMNKNLTGYYEGATVYNMVYVITRIVCGISEEVQKPYIYTLPNFTAKCHMRKVQ